MASPRPAPTPAPPPSCAWTAAKKWPLLANTRVSEVSEVSQMVTTRPLPGHGNQPATARTGGVLGVDAELWQVLRIDQLVAELLRLHLLHGAAVGVLGARLAALGHAHAHAAGARPAHTPARSHLSLTAGAGLRAPAGCQLRRQLRLCKRRAQPPRRTLTAGSWAPGLAGAAPCVAPPPSGPSCRATRACDPSRGEHPLPRAFPSSIL
jgi:hypothetical protein